MKKIISLLLAAILLLTALTLPGTAAETAADPALPESTHPYQNNTEETWTYTYPGPAEGLYVSFHPDTRFDATKTERINALEEDILDGLSEEDLQFFAAYGYLYDPTPDRLYVFIDGAYYYSYGGDELAGAAIYIPGNSFTLMLSTGKVYNDWGFAVEAISPTQPENCAVIDYHLNGKTYRQTAKAGEAVVLNTAQRLRQNGDEMIIGWQTEDGRAWKYSAEEVYTETDLIVEGGAVYDLYPITCKLGMRSDEVFSFTNSDENFDWGYFFTDKDYARNIANWAATFGLTPYRPLAAAVLAFMTVYWPTFDFYGSCCGFPITELLQHYGKIDLLSAQGASCVAELEPTDELTSIINTYNDNCVACHFVNNVALDPGSEAYTAQLKKLYETLEQGTPVYFEFYLGDAHPMKQLAEGTFAEEYGDTHGILLTGAYTADDGSHVIIACDCNSIAYSYGSCDKLVIDKDFTQIDYIDGHGVLYGFSWNDDVSQFDSFKLEGVSNPFAWHIAFFRHFFDTFKQLLALFRANSLR